MRHRGIDRFGPLGACGALGIAPAVLGLLWLSWAGGCGGTPPPTVSSNVIEPEEAGAGVPGRADKELTEGERRKVLSAMRSVTAGERAVERPQAAPDGVRWTDIPLAVGLAVDEKGVEMTILETITEPDRYVFRLETLESLPGTLSIRRVEGPAVYEIEEVKVGLFPDYAPHVKRCERLVKEFQKQLKVLGKQRVFDDE